MEVPTLSELFLAFRQAKTSLFFERRGVGLFELAKFEDDLPSNLRRLRRKLTKNGPWFSCLSTKEMGEVWVVPKRLRQVQDDESDDEIVRVGQYEDDSAHDIDIQLRLTPSPEFAIIEVLYLWEFGALLDSLLSKNAVGYRLNVTNGGIDTTGRRLFEYWPKQYERYRKEPLKAARDILSRDQGPITILSTDLASYYDTVEASFLLQDHFIKKLSDTAASSGQPFDADRYRRATSTLLASHDRFRSLAEKRTGLEWDVGVPIGPITSRVVANVALESLDNHIVDKSNHLHYSRYVDDLIIVGRDGTKGTTNLATVLKEYLPIQEPCDGTIRFDVDELDRPNCQFQIQRDKTRVHHVSGDRGHEYIENVLTDLSNIVSERRAFINPSALLKEPSAELVRTTHDDNSPLHVLRDADRVKLERFALSNKLRSLERAAKLLGSESAKNMASDTLEKLRRVIEGDDDWVEHYGLLIRLLKLAITTKDWQSYRELIHLMDEQWGSKEALQVTANGLYHRGRPVQRNSTWVWLRNYLHERRLQAICSILPLSPSSNVRKRSLDQGLTIRTRELHARGLRRRARLLRRADLRARDREDDSEAFADSTSASREMTWMQSDLSNEKLASRFEDIGRFVDRCEELEEACPWALAPAQLFLSSRPPKYFDIARLWLHNVESDGLDKNIFTELLSVVNAVRGTKYKDPVGEVVDNHTVAISSPSKGLNDQPFQSAEDPRLVLGNLVAEESYYKGAATRQEGSAVGDPVLTKARLLGLTKVIQKAARLTRQNADNGQLRETILVLPELSIPRSWFRELANHIVRFEHFGLVTGLEYLHHPDRPTVCNQVFAVLPGPYRSVAVWPWTKRVPARVERDALDKMDPSISFETVTNSEKRNVVQSPYGDFSVLICSELIESRRVADLVGRVELVLAPSWNRDTASYDHLIRSVSFQLHAIVAVANNGCYSDCRVWAPRTTRWKRSMCRLIQRKTNDVVSVKLPIQSLRSFRYDEKVRADEDAEWRPRPPYWPPLSQPSMDERL